MARIPLGGSHKAARGKGCAFVSGLGIPVFLGCNAFHPRSRIRNKCGNVNIGHSKFPVLPIDFISECIEVKHLALMMREGIIATESGQVTCFSLSQE